MKNRTKTAGGKTRCRCSAWCRKPSSIRKNTSRKSSAPSRTAISRWPAGSRARSAPIIATRDATEIYFCFEGGGTMRTPHETVEVKPGGFVVHPPGEVHEYANGPHRTLFFRVRYGADMASRHVEWRGHPLDAERRRRRLLPASSGRSNLSDAESKGPSHVQETALSGDRHRRALLGRGTGQDLYRRRGRRGPASR